MQKLVFQNHILNIVTGAILIVLSFLGYFLGWFEEFLPIFIGVILLLLSTKRFWYSFKKIISKYATLILIIEFILDIVFAALMIVLQDHINIFMGLILYVRGVAYLIINYVATRKINLFQYILNIVYITIGAFFMFATLNTQDALIYFISFVSLVIGSVYLQHGLRTMIAKEEAKEQRAKEQKQELKDFKEKQKDDLKKEKQTEKDNTKIKKLEQELKLVKEQNKEIKQETKELKVQVNSAEKKEKQTADAEMLTTKTVAELKVIAKQYNITGTSQMNKAQLIDAIRAKK